MTQCGACLLYTPDNLSLDSQNPYKSQPAIKHINTHITYTHIHAHTGTTHMYIHAHTHKVHNNKRKGASHMVILMRSIH